MIYLKWSEILKVMEQNFLPLIVIKCQITGTELIEFMNFDVWEVPISYESKGVYKCLVREEG